MARRSAADSWDPDRWLEWHTELADMRVVADMRDVDGPFDRPGDCSTQE